MPLFFVLMVIGWSCFETGSDPDIMHHKLSSLVIV